MHVIKDEYDRITVIITRPRRERTGHEAHTQLMAAITLLGLVPPVSFAIAAPSCLPGVRWCPTTPVVHRARGARCLDENIAEGEEAPRATSRPVRQAVDPRAEMALAFGAALSEAWGNGGMRFAQTMSRDCAVETPIWSCGERSDYESQLAESREFFSSLGPPVLTVLSHRQLSDGRAQLTWMLGLEWPAVWRPRINILGESILTIEAAGDTLRITRVEETWHQKPREVFTSQVLPKLRDIFSIWCTPTAEHFPLPVVGGGRGFELRRIPPMIALQAEWIEVGSMLYGEQAPLPPFYAFTGEIKRTDWYNTVSPGFLERSFCTWRLPGDMSQAGQRRRWFSPLPTRFGADLSSSALPSFDNCLEPRPGEYEGEEPGLPPEVVSASCQHVRRPSQLIAVRALKESPSNSAVLTAAVELASAAEAAGLRVVKREGRPVIMQLSGDLKYGFNEKRQLAMSVWLSVPNLLREEYVGVVIDEEGGRDIDARV